MSSEEELRSPDWVTIERKLDSIEKEYMLHIESKKFTGSFELSDGDDDIELNVVGNKSGITIGPFTPEELYGLGLECEAEGGHR